MIQVSSSHNQEQNQDQNRELTQQNNYIYLALIIRENDVKTRKSLKIR